MLSASVVTLNPEQYVTSKQQLIRVSRIFGFLWDEISVYVANINAVIAAY